MSTDLQVVKYLECEVLDEKPNQKKKKKYSRTQHKKLDGDNTE